MQDRRRLKKVPDGQPLHEYANLYFHARNPALFLMIKDMGIPHEKLCILRVSPAVLDIEGTVVTDMNAARCCRFERAPDGLSIVDADLTLAEWWADPDPAEKYRRKAYKCAEVLVPDRVPPRYLTGAYVSCSDAQSSFDQFQTGLSSAIDEHMFFL